MIPIFSVHATVGVVDPQFEADRFAEFMEVYAFEYDIPINSGIAAMVLRPEPENEEEEIVQALSPGTHELNIIFDFDPNHLEMLGIFLEDTIWNRYNTAHQLCTAVCMASLKEVKCHPTYFNIKISVDYIEDDLYEKIRQQRFKS